jgi:hypothetical protein
VQPVIGQSVTQWLSGLASQAFFAVQPRAQLATHVSLSAHA